MEMLKAEFEVIRVWLTLQVAGLRREDRDRGSNTSETVIWVAVIVVAALIIGGIIVAKITAKANSVDLQ